MKTKIRRYSRSALSVLLTLCMLVSCFSVAIIGTDAAKVQSDSTGADSVYFVVQNSSGTTVQVVDISTKNAKGDFTVSTGTDYKLFAVTNPSYVNTSELSISGGAWYYQDITNDGSFSIGESKEYAWFKTSRSSYANTLFRFSETQYQVWWNSLSVGSQIQLNIKKKPATITLSAGSISGADATVKVGSTTIAEGGSETVDAGTTATVTVTPDDEHQKATTFTVSGNSTPYTLSPDGKGNYVGTFTTPTADATVTFGALQNKPQYTVNVVFDPSSVTGNGASATVTSSATSPYYEGEVVTLTVTDATSGDYRFKNWSKGATPNKLTTTYVVNSADASGSTINITANFVDISQTLTLYLDVKGANPTWSTPPYVHAWNSSTGVEHNDDVAMTLYKGTVYKIEGIDPRCDKIEFYDISQKAATQTGGLTIPANGYVYKLRSKTWGNDPDSTAANHYTATADPTSITNNPNVYSDIKATFFDYYNDQEFNQQNAGNNPAWLSIDKKYAFKDEPYYHEINTHLNKALSDYAANSSTSVAFPLYFGDFFARDNGYTGAGTNTKPSGQTSNGFLLNDLGVANSTATNFNKKVNHNLNGVDGGNDNTAITGLSGKSLEEGIIHYYKSGATDENGAKMVLFDEDWLTEQSQNGQGELASIIDSPFPVRITKKFAPSKVYLDAGEWGGWPDHNITTYRAKFYNGDTLISTVDLTEVSTKFYSGEIPDNATHVVFCRYANGEEHNATSKMAIPTEKKKYTPGTGWQDYADAEGRSYNYYGFNSDQGTDNAWFEGLKTTNTTIKYAANDKKHSEGGHVYISSTNSTMGFFPFEGGVTGDRASNSDFSHDLGFGVKLEFEFTLGEGGKLYGQDQIFEYSGDDDLWVFVDDKLLLDLGGDHFKSSGKINFATKTVEATNTQSIDGKTRNTFASAFGSNDNFDNNDTSAIHKMTIYYLERGMFDSNLQFGFSISPVGNQFVNEKKVSVKDVNEALKQETEVYSQNDKFDYTLKQSASDSPANYSTVNNAAYKLNPDGTTQYTNSGGFTLAVDQNASFVDKLTTGRYFQVTETPSTANDNENKYSYTPNLYVYDMIYGNEITLSGSGDDAGYKFLTTKSGDITEKDATKIEALWTNYVNTRDITISKSVPADVLTNPNFTFKVLVKLPGSSGFYPYPLECSVGDTGGTTTIPDELDDYGEITIKKGKTITIHGLPVGSEIQVTEEAIPTGFSLQTKTVTGTNTKNESYSANGVSFTVDDSAITAVNTVFSNDTDKQTVVIRKIVNGEDNSTTRFPITVNIKSDGVNNDTSYTYTRGTATTATVTAAPTGTLSLSGTTGDSMGLMEGENLTFRLPVGAVVTVTETDFSSNSDFDAYDFASATAVTTKSDGTTAYTNATNSANTTSFTVVSGDNALVTITNTHKQSLIITKTLGNDPDEIDDYGTLFDVLIEKYDAVNDEWVAIQDELDYPHYDFDMQTKIKTWNANGKLRPQLIVEEQAKRYQINKGCQLIIPNLPVGTQIRVTETYWYSQYYNFGSMSLLSGSTQNITTNEKTAVVTIVGNDTLVINNQPIREKVVITKTTDYDINDGSTFNILVESKQFNSASSLSANPNGAMKVNSTADAVTDADAHADGHYAIEKDGSITFENVPRGTYFEVTETRADISASPATPGIERFAPDWVHVGSNTANMNGLPWTVEADSNTHTVNVEVHNKIKRNDLTIVKDIIDSSDAQTTHTITVTAKKQKGADASYSSFYYKSNKDAVNARLHEYTAGDPIQFVQGEVLTFYVDKKNVEIEYPADSGTMITVENGIQFPIGTYFTVEETSPGTSFAFSHFTTNAVTVDPTPAEGVSVISFYTIDATNTVNLTIHNKIDKILYQIKYIFPSRSYLINSSKGNAGDPQFGSDMAFTTEVIEAQKNVVIEDEKIKKTVLQDNTPYEKNFMQKMTWDYNHATYSIDTSGTRPVYKAQVVATNGTFPTKRIEFFFPYKVEPVEVTGGSGYLNFYYAPVDETPALEEDFRDAQVLSNALPYQSNPIISKTKTVQVTNDQGETVEQTVTEHFGTTAAATTIDGDKFLYWSIRSKNKNIAKDNNAYQYVEVARCYELQFNYTLFDDYKVYAIYENGPDDDGTAHDKNTDQYTTINFLDYSRNRWNNGDRGTNGAEEYPEYTKGDIVWTDFDVAYENGYVELAQSANTEVGILVEKVQDDLDRVDPGDPDSAYISMDPDAAGYATNYQYYVNNKAEDRTAVVNFLKSTYANKKDDNNNLQYSRKKIDKNNLTNKGRTEYGYGVFVEADSANKTVAKNALYRAYSYIKVKNANGTYSIILCEKPVYFSVKHEANKVR